MIGGFFKMNVFLTNGFATQVPTTGSSMMLMIGYFIIIIGAFYLFAIRPQKKQQKKHEMLLSTLEPGDSVLTSAGFYGVAIDIREDLVIVEFGSNKNCRIPMKKESIIEIEKATQ